jgi:hypothetical protein
VLRSIAGQPVIALFLRPPRRRRPGGRRAAWFAFAANVVLTVLAALLITQLAGLLI